MAEFEKVIGTITVNKNILQVDNQFAGNMFSSDLTYNVNFTDDFWTGFDILEWYAASSVVGETVVCKYDSVNKKLKIPYGAYIKNGPLYISMRGIKDSVKYASNILVLLVGENINIEENDIVNDPSWLDKVQSIIDDVFVSKYDPQYEALVQKVEKQISANKELLDKTQEQQNQIDNAIDIMGDYEIVQENPTQIRFKKGNGTYGDTVNLGDNLASKSMVNAGYDTYSGNSYSGSASDYGIEIGKASGNYEQEGTPTPESPVEPKFFEPKEFFSVGKNCLDHSSADKFSSFSEIDDDGYINITANGNYKNFYIKKSSVTLKPNTTYTFVVDVKENSLVGSGTQITFGNSLEGSEQTYFDSYKKIDFSSPLTVGITKFKLTTKEKFYDSNIMYGDRGLVSNTATSGSIKFRYAIYEGDLTNVDIGFEPFKGSNITPLNIELRELPNGVRDTYENGVITRRVGEIEFDGSSDENWVKEVEKEITQVFKLQKMLDSVENSAICNKFRYSEGDDSEGFAIASGYLYIGINKTRLTELTASALKTWLQSHPIKVWYQLATPTTEEVELPVIPSYYPYTNAWHDSEVEASNLTWHVLTAVNGKSSIRDGSGALLKDATMTPNDNLLINSDYRSGIINQKGQTSYTKGSEDWGKMYSIDMWAIQRGIQLSVNSNIISVECTNSNEPGYLLQKLDYVGKATAAINIKSITGSVSLNTAYGKYELLKKGLNIITYDFGFEQSDSWFSIRISEGSTVEIDFMKLEPGEHFTGMPTLSIALELEKCMRKLEIGTITMPVINGHISHFQFKTKKNKIPTISYENVKCGYEGVNGMKNSSDVKQSSVTTRGINFTQDAYSGILWFSCDYIADSYDY